MASVFIISTLPMFGEGIDAVLRCQKGMKLLGCERDIPKALALIAALRPEVVIFDCQAESSELRAAVQQILAQGNDVKIIGLDIQSNTFFVYTHQQHEIKKLEDLFREID